MVASATIRGQFLPMSPALREFPLMRRPEIWLSFVALMVLIPQPGWGQDPPEPPVGARVGSPVAAGPEVIRRIFDVELDPVDPAQLAGLPDDAKPQPLTWERVFDLALIQARSADHPRFAELDPTELADQAQRVARDDFNRFRADFAANSTFRDLAADFLHLQARLLEIESHRRIIALHECWTAILQELINGDNPGVNLLFIDAAKSAGNRVRLDWLRSVESYRNELDEFKVKLGLAPSAAVTVAGSSLASFQETFKRIDRWSIRGQGDLAALDSIVNQLPGLGDIVIEGRSIFAELDESPDRLGDVLALATRVARACPIKGPETTDSREFRVRQRVRHLAELRYEYRSALKDTVLALRVLDGTFDQVLAPPTEDIPKRVIATAQSLISQSALINAWRNRIVTLWVDMTSEQLALQRDLGLFPATDWAGFFDQFTARPPAPVVESTSRVEPAPPSPPPVAPAPPTNPAPPPAPPGG